MNKYGQDRLQGCVRVVTTQTIIRIRLIKRPAVCSMYETRIIALRSLNIQVI